MESQNSGSNSTGHSGLRHTSFSQQDDMTSVDIPPPLPSLDFLHIVDEVYEISTDRHLTARVKENSSSPPHSYVVRQVWNDIVTALNATGSTITETQFFNDMRNFRYADPIGGIPKLGRLVLPRCRVQIGTICIDRKKDTHTCKNHCPVVTADVIYQDGDSGARTVSLKHVRVDGSDGHRPMEASESLFKFKAGPWIQSYLDAMRPIVNEYIQKYNLELALWLAATTSWHIIRDDPVYSWKFWSQFLVDLQAQIAELEKAIRTPQ